ncbi:hypothetical protein ACFV6F_15790 [Kitasatospora phosalacinea]|uniref:hypothetical protein n=1 Tax=Kitasatospora phosalacinea TaxID=2065 RepID=UPI00365F91D3
MKTRRKGGAPDPGAPWDEIAPGLWMGGHHWTDAAGQLRPVVAGAGPAEAVRRVRAGRSSWALHNGLFVEYLDVGLDVARLLVSLEALDSS